MFAFSLAGLTNEFLCESICKFSRAARFLTHDFLAMTQFRFRILFSQLTCSEKRKKIRDTL